MKSLKNHPNVKSYLKEVCRRIKSKQIREEVYLELLAHIDAEVIEIMKNQSIDQEGAIELALSKIGEPKKLSHEFFDVYHWSWKIWSGIAAGLLASVLIFSSFYTHNLLEGRRSVVVTLQKRALDLIDPYMADVASLKNVNFFPSSQRLADAGEVLNQRFFYVKNGPSVPSVLTIDNVPSIVWENDYKIDSLNLSDREAVRSYDIRWMNELLNYDHWDFLKTGPLAYLSNTNSDAIVYDQHLVNVQLMSLLDAVEIRLAKGLEDKKLLEAFQEVHHLARLLNTTENVAAVNIALDILNLEACIFNIGKDQGLITHAMHTTFNPEVIETARNVLKYTQKLMGVGILDNPHVLKALLESNNIPFGFCAAMRNAYVSDTNITAGYQDNLDSLKKRYSGVCLAKDIPVSSPSYREMMEKDIKRTLVTRDFMDDIKKGNLRPWRLFVVDAIALLIPTAYAAHNFYWSSFNVPHIPDHYMREDSMRLHPTHKMKILKKKGST